MAISYQAQLLLRLAAGAAALPEETRRRQAGYFRSNQRDDGGFAGRRGPSNPYYTSFALRGLAVLGELADDVAGRAGDFLRGQLVHARTSSLLAMSPADFLALVEGGALVELAVGREIFAEAGLDRRQTVVDYCTPLRRDDGGYAKTPRGGASSTYQTFLVAMGKQTVGAPPDDAGQIAEFVRARQRADGGFVEMAVLAHSGTNPTAAAVGLLRMQEEEKGEKGDSPHLCDDHASMVPASGPLGQMGTVPFFRPGAVGFLAAMQTPEGGLRAHARLPVADLLSTFTGLLTLADLDALGAIDVAAAGRFVRSLELPGGGFRAGAWDDAADVEYAFYGLAALSLLQR